MDTDAAAPPAAAPGPVRAASPPVRGARSGPVLSDGCVFASDSSGSDTYEKFLRELTIRTIQKLPIYLTECKGQEYQLKFRSTIQVSSEEFYSVHCHSRLKDAEQDAAKVAYEILSKIDDNEFTHVLGLIDQDVVFSKSVLHYTLGPLEGLGPMILFVSSVLFTGNTYTGEAATSKKHAQQKAARAAIRSI